MKKSDHIAEMLDEWKRATARADDLYKKASEQGCILDQIKTLADLGTYLEGQDKLREAHNLFFVIIRLVEGAERYSP